MTTIEQLAGIEDKPPEAVTWNPPIWWRTPERQLERARQLWPDAVLPEPPKEFVPKTKSEVLLLHVPDSFDSLSSKVGWTVFRAKVSRRDKRLGRMERDRTFVVDEQYLQLSSSAYDHTTPVWLAFDPEYGKGESPDLLVQVNLAASEVLSALIQFPGWVEAWSSGASRPNLSGYRLSVGASWLVPFICLQWSEAYHGRIALELENRLGGQRDAMFASPSVRML